SIALQTLTFTPSSPGDYLVFAKVDQHEIPGASTSQAWLEDPHGLQHPDDKTGIRFSNGRASWQPMFTGTRSTFPASSSGCTLRGTSASANGEAPDWWNLVFAFRKKLTITAPAAAAIPAKYSIVVPIDHAALASAFRSLPDGTDLRIARRTAANTWTEVDRV